MYCIRAHSHALYTNCWFFRFVRVETNIARSNVKIYFSRNILRELPKLPIPNFKMSSDRFWPMGGTCEIKYIWASRAQSYLVGAITFIVFASNVIHNLNKQMLLRTFVFVYRKHNVFFHIHLHRCRRLPLRPFFFSPVIIAYLYFLIHALTLNSPHGARDAQHFSLSRSLSISCFFFSVDVVNNSETYLLFLRAFIVCVRAALCALKWRKRALTHITRSTYPLTQPHICKNHKFIRNKLLSYSMLRQINYYYFHSPCRPWIGDLGFHQRIIPNGIWISFLLSLSLNFHPRVDSGTLYIL